MGAPGSFTLAMLGDSLVNAATHSGAVVLTPAKLGLSLLVIAAVVGWSSYLELDLTRRVLVATARTYVQLALLGLILVPIFTTSHPAVVFAYVFFMNFLAAWEASARPKLEYAGLSRILYGDKR